MKRVINIASYILLVPGVFLTFGLIKSFGHKTGIILLFLSFALNGVYSFLYTKSLKPKDYFERLDRIESMRNSRNTIIVCLIVAITLFFIKF